VNTSWRVDETYLKVRGKWHFLYRAVDKHCKTADFLIRPDRSVAAAQAFFRKALSRCLPRWPRKITLDGLKQSHVALRLLRREDLRWKYVQVRCSQYLNNLIEQDHRAIKRRCASMTGFKSFRSAAITLAGIELAHRIRKRQFSLGRGRYRNFGSLKQIWDRAPVMQQFQFPPFPATHFSISRRLAARSIRRVSTTPSSCTATRRSDIALARRSSHRATTGLSPRSPILWSAVADR
jgi:transposase-like protein